MEAQPVTTARHYRIRLAKGAAYSALKVWRGFAVDPVTEELLVERPFLWRAILNGEHVPIEDLMIEMSEGRPLIKGEEISEDDYDLLLARNLWAETHKPDAPEAAIRKPINHLQGDLIF